MPLQREVRDCPQCGAHRGFCCREPGCPQRQEVDAQAELDALLSGWPFIKPPDDAS